MLTLADSLTPPQTVLLIAPLAALLAIVIYSPFWLARRKTLTDVLRVLDDVSDGRTGRRADPTARGLAGKLSRRANALAAAQETRQQQAAVDRQRINAVLEHTRDLMLISDENDRICTINVAGAALLGRTVEATLGQPLTGVITQKDLFDLYRAARSSNEPLSSRLRLVTASRTMQCEVVAAALTSGTQYRGTLLVLRDLTELTSAIQMKTDFVTNASHELRTPLASIRAAVETIQDSWAELLADPHGADAQSTRRCVDIIGGHVLRLQMMVQDLLDLSRTEDPRAVVRMDRVDLMHVSELVTGMYAALAHEKQIELRVDLAADATSMRGDERLLVLVLKNLVDNSLKFTPQGGQIVIRAHRDERVRLAVESARDATRMAAMEALILEVSDTGCGIPAEDQQRVFERFYTVNRSRGGADRGTGLGLAIVKHAVAAMEGTLALESQVHQGTTIRCIFPVPRAVRPTLQPA